MKPNLPIFYVSLLFLDSAIITKATFPLYDHLLSVGIVSGLFHIQINLTPIAIPQGKFQYFLCTLKETETKEGYVKYKDHLVVKIQHWNLGLCFQSLLTIS